MNKSYYNIIIYIYIYMIFIYYSFQCYFATFDSLQFCLVIVFVMCTHQSMPIGSTLSMELRVPVPTAGTI